MNQIDQISKMSLVILLTKQKEMKLLFCSFLKEQFITFSYYVTIILLTRHEESPLIHANKHIIGAKTTQKNKIEPCFIHLTWEMCMGSIDIKYLSKIKFYIIELQLLIKINNFPASNIRDAEQKADVGYNKISTYFCTAWKEYIQIKIFNMNNRNILHFMCHE